MTTPLRQAYAATSRESPNAIVRLGRSWLGRVLRLSGQSHGPRLLVSGVFSLVGAVAHCEAWGTRVFKAILGLDGGLEAAGCA